MNTPFDLLRITRRNLLDTIAPLTLDQLHHIPEGFNNNVIWNVAHVLVTQQLLHYRLAGLSANVGDALIDAFRKGTAPGEQRHSAQAVQTLKDDLLRTADLLEADYLAGKWAELTYTPYTTSFQVTLAHIDDAIAFNNLHEAMHLGTVKALAKLL